MNVIPFPSRRPKPVPIDVTEAKRRIMDLLRMPYASDPPAEGEYDARCMTVQAEMERYGLTPADFEEAG